MSAAVATASSRRNSSSTSALVAPAPSFLSGLRRMSATTAPPPAPTSAGPVRMTSLAQAAALATAEAERRAAAAAAARSAATSSPQTSKNTSGSSRQTRANSNASTRMNAMKAASASHNSPAASTQKPKARTKQSSREVVLTTTPHAPSVAAAAASPQDETVYLTISVLGLKFKCRVQREWPCEAMIATAIAEYHLAFPTCEIPDFNTIYHMDRKEFLKASEPIGSLCDDNDEIELGITEKPTSGPPAARSDVSTGSSDGGRREMFDFMILFHRLPLGFTLKQNNEHIVVANIYPHSTATHYERLENGVRVIKIADTLLENLGLRQVHDLIKNAKIPLEICFRGFKKPSLRATLLMAAANPAAPTESRIPSRRRSVPSPKPEDDSASPPRSTRERARTTSNSSARRVELVTTTMSSASPQSREQRPVSASSRRSGRSHRGSQESKDERELLQSSVPLDAHDNQSNNGGGRSPAQPLSRRGRTASRSVNHAAHAVDDDDEPLDVRHCDEDSNQNDDDDDAEAQLVDQIKALQVALLKKHEEAKAIARQIEQFHEKLTAVRTAKSSKHSDGDADVPPLPHSAPASTTAPPSSLKLRLTPEVLEAMDSKAGVPPKSASYYQSSNVSSVSGYSNYSRGSNAPRSARPSRRGAENMRSDASVVSHSSATSERRRSSSRSRSPRSQCVKNINNRYSYVPQKYSAHASSSSAEAPTSLSSRGAVMSRARVTRDSFITKSDAPGVGYYDVKLPASHVRGGEIGDSDRSLPWP